MTILLLFFGIQINLVGCWLLLVVGCDIMKKNVFNGGGGGDDDVVCVVVEMVTLVYTHPNKLFLFFLLD